MLQKEHHKRLNSVGLTATYLSDLSFLSAGLSNCDLPQETVICVNNWGEKMKKRV